MREEKVIMDFPDIADKLIEMNSQVDNPECKVVIDIPFIYLQKHKDVNPACALKMKRFDPSRSAVMSTIAEVETRNKASKVSLGTRKF